MNLCDIDLNLLVVLDALLREEHVTKAGERLGLSQSATSRALKKLRVLFQDDLLIKGHQGMNLSARACQLRPAVAQALDDLQHLFVPAPLFDPSSFQGTLHISVGPWVPDTITTTLMCSIMQDAPHAQVSCARAHTLSTHTPVDAHLDLRWGTNAQETTRSEELATSHWVVMRARDVEMVPGTMLVGARHHDLVVPGTNSFLEVSTAQQVYEIIKRLNCPGVVLKRAQMNKVEHEWVQDVVPDTTSVLWLSWCQTPSYAVQEWLKHQVMQSLIEP